MAYQKERAEKKQDPSSVKFEVGEAFVLDYPSRCILRNKAIKDLAARPVKKEADEAKTRGSVINDGTLNAAVKQLLLTILYPPDSAVPPSVTIIPDLTLTSGAIAKSVQDGLTNPETKDQYVNAIAEFSNQFNLKYSLTKANGTKGAGTADLETLDKAYGAIVGQAKSTQPMPADALKEYKKLQKQLWSPGVTNKFTGITSARQKTPLYEAEQTAQLAYYDALSNYYQVKQKTLAEKGGAATWSEIGPIEQQKVDMAMNDWTSSGKDQVALIISQMDNLLKGYPGELITEARQAFTKSTNNSEKFGNYHQCLPTPSDVFSTTSTAWATITTSKGQDFSETMESATKAGFDGSAQWGLWSVSASGSHEKATKHTDSESSNTTVQLEYARVRLTRPWLATTWMQSNGWTYLQTAPGSISKGTVANNIDQQLIIGAVPSELVLAKNVTVTANFSKDVYDSLKTANSGSASVGWGPFKVGGSFSNSSFKETSSSESGNGELKMPGPFVIGYVVNTLPFSAPKPDGDK
mmetsp:Transcript_15566/g.13977  ORF Transcript_15566/g.13977 Transcript_15566/m.13977 type:complete len:523 (+) Transcript_15566:118-1686(+)